MDGQAPDSRHRTDQNGVQSVEVAGQILEVMIQADGPLKLAEIASTLGMPPAKVHRYLVSLIRTGLAIQSRETSKYDLGPTAFQLGIKGFARFEPLKAAEAMLRELVEMVGETAALAVWSEKGPTMIRVIEARHDFATTIAPTHHCPLTFSATGVLFASFEDPARTDPVIERELEQNRNSGRPNAPRDRASLAEMIARTRDRGFSVLHNGGGDGFGAVSAPVFDVTGRLRLAITVFGRAGRVDASPDSALARIVARTARSVSAEFGYRN
ncbi:MAG: IclR family transcriptional regulator [Alphaproteobacteria bacterium]|nr:IclR family transcriptional regulator [Alphaproteobacteria bacterium]